MKKLFLLLCILLPIISKSQSVDTSFTQVDEKFKKAGAEMIKFNSSFHTGVFLEILGGVFVAAGSALGSSSSVHDSQTIQIAGGVISLIGFIITMTSTTHVKKAGLILQGNSLVIPLHKK